MPVLDLASPEVARFKTAFKVAAKKKVVSAGKKEQEDQNLLKGAKAKGLERLKREEVGNKRQVDELPGKIVEHKERGEHIEAALASFELENAQKSLKSLKMLEHNNKQWLALEEEWNKILRQDVPRGREDEVSALRLEGTRIIEAKDDAKEMKRIAKALNVLLKLKEPDSSYMEIFVNNGRNWFKVKEKYVAGEITKDKMTELWNYRQKIVDKMLADMKNEFKFEHAAVGSTDLTSDIDVGIISHGETSDGKIFLDWQIVNEFNDRFKKTFRQEPGVFFDVNLYASAPKATVVDDLEDDNPAKKSMKAMANAGQDVGALMKQRRYMTYEEYDDYQEAILEPYRAQLEVAKRNGDTEAQAELQELIDITAKQFSEADSLYQMSLRRSLEKAGDVLRARLNELPVKPSYARTPEESKEFEAASRKLEEFLESFREISNERDLAEGQKKLIEAVEKIEHDLDLSMAVNNQIYTEAIEEVRRLEEEIFRLQQAASDLVERVRDLEQRMGPAEGDAKLEIMQELSLAKFELDYMTNDKKVAGLTARISDLYADGVLFANEAYLSEGPMKHIVDSAQGAKFHLEAGKVDDVSAFDWETMSEEEKTEKLKKVQQERRSGLSTHECLQSFNEQFGDMLKDLNHYKSEAAGFAFYRSSKYLARLLDAIDLLQGKLTMINWGGVLRDGGLSSPAAQLSASVGAQILPIRGGKGDNLIERPKQYDPVEGDNPETIAEKVQAKEEALQRHVVTQMRELFGVTDVGALKTLMNNISKQINVACREQIAKEMKATDDSAYFQSVGSGDKDPSGGKVRR